jgi:hypothetical protein
LEFDNPTTLKADEVVMLGSGFDFIAVARLVDMDLLYKPHFLQGLQGTINSGQAEAGLFLPSPLVNFISIEMSASLLKNFHN